jgi:hypothetical protein
MATASDILMIENEYNFTGGDFNIGFSDSQHIQDLIFENKGAYKQFPLVGVGIMNYLNSSGAVLLLKRDIEIQLSNDGYLINEIKFIQNEISNFTIDAVRN